MNLLNLVSSTQMISLDVAPIFMAVMVLWCWFGTQKKNNNKNSISHFLCLERSEMYTIKTNF